MTNRALIHEFYKKVKKRKFLSFIPGFSNFMIYYLGASKLARSAKFKHNISKIMPKMYRYTRSGTTVAYILPNVTLI